MRLFVCVYVYVCVYVIIYALFSEDVQHENEEYSPNVF